MPGLLFAQTVSHKLYLNTGDFTAVDGAAFPYAAFNESPAFSMRNADIHLAPGDSLAVMLVNNDTVAHYFSVQGISGSLMVAAGDSGNASFYFPDAGTYIYADTQSTPGYAYLGAAGIVAVTDGSEDANFYWNVKTHDSSFNAQLLAGQFVDWAQYDPDYNTVNGLSKPDIEADSSAKIRGTVGEKILIHVANTGPGVHSMHFHGYHVRILYDSRGPKRLNWDKDTVPIRSMSSVTLELIPHQPGLFPVHDHNLTALTGNNYYPNGIFLMMEVQP